MRSARDEHAGICPPFPPKLAPFASPGRSPSAERDEEREICPALSVKLTVGTIAVGECVRGVADGETETIGGSGALLTLDI
mmetsp:Transcript_28928/g.72618  ORF Transcript_28928/g.72618 Transcript_28928/m.72618 type:complete len:81 (+) Transcript_28928:1838-2080(+)